MSIEHGQAASQSEDESSPPAGRRGFLTRSGVLMAVLAAGGVGTTEASAQSAGPVGVGVLSEKEARKLEAVIKQTISNKGNLQDAIEAQNAKLSPQVLDILKAMTSEDWAAAGRVNSKLKGLDAFMAGDNNGYAGM